MATNQANIAKIVVDSLSIMDTASEDGVTAIATATAGGNSTFTCTGLNVLLNALAGMDIVVFSGTGSPAIKNIASNTATSAGSTVITITGTWATNPAAGSLAQIAPSATWVNLGMVGEAPVKVEVKKAGLIPISDGGNLQKCYELAITSNALQVLDSSVIEAYKNKVVWLKANPASSSSHTLIIRNVRINVEASLDLSVKGVSVMNLNASEVVRNYADAIVIA